MIALRAKDARFETTYIDLRDKPDWFLRISPHGKVPVLLVDGAPLFESNAIGEYLDEVEPPRLHPADPVKRARNRAWTDFVPTFAQALSGIYYAASRADADAAIGKAPARLAPVEEALAQEREGDGPYFNGAALSLVDAAYAPFLQRFAFVERRLQTGLLSAFPRLRSWSDALLADERVSGAVPPGFEQAFIANLRRRGTHAATLFEQDAAAG